ncbi:MAG: YlmH/Sll1252 family protein [bacterium]|nr:YlmH/Sll1252 family protein [bacterium]
MPKQEQNDKLLLAKTEDLFRLCEKYACVRFSDFLDGAEQAVIEDSGISRYGFNVMLFGGFKGSERKIMGVFPEWEEPCEAAFPIKALTIESGIGRELNHRDYLGTFLSLGFDRSKTGDIVVDGKRAYALVCEDIADYIRNNISKIGSQGVKITVSDPAEITVPEPKLQRISAVCASMRLDAVTGAAAGVSRSNAAALIRGSKVQINHRLCEDVSKTVKEGDLLSIRGSGRFIASAVSGETRSGRIHIELLKYI